MLDLTLARTLALQARALGYNLMLAEMKLVREHFELRLIIPGALSPRPIVMPTQIQALANQARDSSFKQ